MTRITRAVAAVAAAGLLLTSTGCTPRPDRTVESTAGTLPAPADSPASPPHAGPGFIYGRITTVDGAVYEGRLRWGGDQEAFWGDYFNGARNENPWTAQMASDQRPAERRHIEIFGFRFGGRDRATERLFMSRFGDLARIEAHFRDVRVTLKSGTTVVLDGFEAGDIDDGVRVWDRRGIVDLDARQIRTIEFLPTAPLVAAPTRLHGTVRTRQGDFTGFLQWDQDDGTGADELEGRTAEGDVSIRYDTIRSIARRSPESALVTRLDGRALVLSGTRAVSSRNRGIYVDEPRYGRVLISWTAFDRVDFSPAGSGPAYADFPPGRPLAGSVTMHDGRRFVGRLVYDLDESETTETLDAARQGIDYNIPFGLIASILPSGDDDPSRATVILRSGERLALEPTGDLGDRHAGLLIFAAGQPRPEYVAWPDVARVDLEIGVGSPF